MTETFFCGSCAKHRPLHLFAKKRPNGVKQCATCEENAVKGRAKAATDVVGHYSNGKPILRQHDAVHRDKQKRKRYANGAAATFFDKAGIT